MTPAIRFGLFIALYSTQYEPSPNMRPVRLRRVEVVPFQRPVAETVLMGVVALVASPAPPPPPPHPTAAAAIAMIALNLSDLKFMMPSGCIGQRTVAQTKPFCR